MKRQVLSALLIMLVGFGGLLQLSSFVHSNREYLPKNFIRLVPPPPEALASDFGTPLVTTDIGLFAYYEAADWDLNDVIPACHNYTQYTNYIDGYVRVWIDVDGTTFEGDEDHNPAIDDRYGYIDVSVRVRSDGWILAWIEDTQNKAFICHWGGNIKTTTDNNTPNDYETCLGRAIHRVYHNAGVSWVGYDVINYYDYEFPDATRLSIFGLLNRDGAGALPNEEHFYFIIPSGITIEECWLAFGGTQGAGDGVWLDNVNQDGYGASSYGWYAVDITSSLSVSTRHDVKTDHDAASQSGICVACILWSS